MNLSSNRWVLLHHQVGDSISDRGDHFDFMLSSAGISQEDDGLETPGSKDALPLWTWAIPINPLQQPLPLACAADRLPDHRAAYLDYEGPVSGDRGHVERVASGSYEVVVWSKQRIELRMQCSDPTVTGRNGLFLVSLKQTSEGWGLRWSAMN